MKYSQNGKEPKEPNCRTRDPLTGEQAGQLLVEWDVVEQEGCDEGGGKRLQKQ